MLGRFTHWLHRSKTKPALDPNDICCEIYNPTNETITFTSIHPKKDIHYFRHPKTGIVHTPSHWYTAVCNPGEWVFLPHQQYIGTVPSGCDQISVIKNFGDRMFKGEKYPSRPEASAVSVNNKAIY